MCYAAPGPRCSAHADRDLAKAQDAFAKAQEALWDARRNPQLTADEVQAVRQTAMEATESRDRAMRDFDATPAGIKDLKSQLAILEKQQGVLAVERPEYVSVMKRISDGQQRRAEQLAAYKATRGTAAGPKVNEDGSAVDSAWDEAEAAEVPACACIAYRYKKTCSHLANPTTAARKTMLPTTAEASTRLHDANALMRHARSKRIQADAMAMEANALRGQFDPEHSLATRQLEAEAFRNLKMAQEAFYETPGGQEYLNRKIEEARTNYGGPGGYAPGSIAGLAQLWDKSTQRRREQEQDFRTLTGQDVPTEDPADAVTPPTVEGACSCDDGQWTGACAHTTDDPVETAKLRAAYTAKQEAAVEKGRREGRWFRRVWRDLGRPGGEDAMTSIQSTSRRAAGF